MNVTQLRQALSGDPVRKEIVLERIEQTRSARRRARLAIASSSAAAVAMVVVVTVTGPWAGRPSRPQAPASVQTGSGCAPLRERLARTASRSQSVVEAFGRLTGRSASSDGTPYRQMMLTGVRTLSGPLMPATVTGWIETSPYVAPDAADAPGLWGLDGHLVAILTPSTVAHTAVGPVLSTAPIAGGNVILSPAACWADPTLATTPFTGPLQEIKGSSSYNLAKQQGGFHAYPLRSFIRLVP